MVKVKCDKCEWKATKSSAGSAAQSLQMHKARKHGGMKTWNQGAVGKSRGPYKKGKAVVQSVAVNFCPNCGTDIHGVAMGLVLAGRLKKGSR